MSSFIAEFNKRYERSSEQFEIETSIGDLFAFRPYSSLTEMKDATKELKEGVPHPDMIPYLPESKESDTYTAVASLLKTCTGVKFLQEIIEDDKERTPVYEECAPPTVMEWFMAAKSNEIVFNEIYSKWAERQYKAEGNFHAEVIRKAGEDLGEVQ